MIIFPAIDLKDNQCVRLTQGDFKQITVYNEQPDKEANKWVASGAEYLHLVSLDGAKDGGIRNEKAIRSILDAIDIPVQLGGGVRDKTIVDYLLGLGVTRVIVGTMAIKEFDLLAELVKTYPGQIVVSVDAKNGFVATEGWQEVSEVDSVSFCKKLESIGVDTVVYTDISKDGMMVGPNFEVYETLNEETNLNIIASGGVTTIDDIKRLNKMNMYGAIIGKALYENLLTLEEVLACLREE